MRGMPVRLGTARLATELCGQIKDEDWSNGVRRAAPEHVVPLKLWIFSKAYQLHWNFRGGGGVG